MSQNSEDHLHLLLPPPATTQGGSQAPLVTGDRALDLPALAVEASVKSTLHLPAVLGLGPLEGVPLASRDDRRADPEFLAAQDVVVLGIVTLVAQDAIEVNELCRVSHGGSELRRVLRGTHADIGTGQEMAFLVADEGELGPPESCVALLTLPPDVVAADVATFETGGIDDAVGLLSNELQLASAAEDVSLKKSEGSFFKSRPSAYERVE